MGATPPAATRIPVAHRLRGWRNAGRREGRHEDRRRRLSDRLAQSLERLCGQAARLGAHRRRAGGGAPRFPEYGALELASLAGEDNARDPERVLDAVSARIKDVDELHGSLAREFGVHICAASGPVRRKGDRKPVNRARLFAPDGSFEVQDKMILTRFEREAWRLAPGDALRVFETALGRIGILIGCDGAFPLLGRAMVEAGADILLVPASAESMRDYWRLRIGAMARAFENQCVVAHATDGRSRRLAAGRGDEPRRRRDLAPPDEGFPEDGVIASGKPDVAGWVHGEVSLDALRQGRAAGAVPAFRDWAEQAEQPERTAVVETVSLGGVRQRS